MVSCHPPLDTRAPADCKHGAQSCRDVTSRFSEEPEWSLRWVVPAAVAILAGPDSTYLPANKKLGFEVQCGWSWSGPGLLTS